MNWHDRYKRMKSGLGWTNAEIAQLLEKTERTVTVQTSPSSNRGFPAWARAMVIMYEKYGYRPE